MSTLSHGHMVTSFEPTAQPFPATATSGSFYVPLLLRDDVFSLVAYNKYATGPAAKATVTLELAPRAPKVTVLSLPAPARWPWSGSTSPLRTRTQESALSAASRFTRAPTRARRAGPLAGSQLTYDISTSPSGATTAITLTVSGLADRTDYYFKVDADNAAGSSLPSAEVKAGTLGPPSAPGRPRLAAQAGNHEVFLTWQAPTSDGGAPQTGYDIYMGTSPGESATPRWPPPPPAPPSSTRTRRRSPTVPNTTSRSRPSIGSGPGRPPTRLQPPRCRPPQHPGPGGNARRGEHQARLRPAPTGPVAAPSAAMTSTRARHRGLRGRRPSGWRPARRAAP